MKTKRQESGASPIGEEAEIADAHKTFGKQVQQEAAQEFIARQGHELVFVVMSGVAPAEGDLVSGFSPQAMPVFAQFLEQLGAEDHIPIFAPFATTDVNHHALTIDIADPQAR